jgi:hypothetical protein
MDIAPMFSAADSTRSENGAPISSLEIKLHNNAINADLNVSILRRWRQDYSFEGIEFQSSFIRM